MLSNVSSAIAGATVAGCVLWYHWFLVLRTDLGAMHQIAEDRYAVAVISGLDAGDVERLKEFARTALDGSRTRVYWTDQAHARETLESAARNEPRTATE
jgi:hypothetical protein